MEKHFLQCGMKRCVFDDAASFFLLALGAPCVICNTSSLHIHLTACIPLVKLPTCTHTAVTALRSKQCLSCLHCFTSQPVKCWTSEATGAFYAELVSLYFPQAVLVMKENVLVMLKCANFGMQSMKNGFHCDSSITRQSPLCNLRLYIRLFFDFSPILWLKQMKSIKNHKLSSWNIIIPVPSAGQVVLVYGFDHFAFLIHMCALKHFSACSLI